MQTTTYGENKYFMKLTISPQRFVRVYLWRIRSGIAEHCFHFIAFLDRIPELNVKNHHPNHAAEFFGYRKVWIRLWVSSKLRQPILCKVMVWKSDGIAICRIRCDPCLVKITSKSGIGAKRCCRQLTSRTAQPLPFSTWKPLKTYCFGMPQKLEKKDLWLSSIAYKQATPR